MIPKMWWPRYKDSFSPLTSMCQAINMLTLVEVYKMAF